MAKVDKISGSKVRIEIEVSAHHFEHGLDHAFDAMKEDVEIKGFRKGKVPRSVFEQKFGVESLYEEAINHVLQETYINAVTEHGIEVVAQPKIDLDITKVKRGEPFTYVAEVAVKPEVTLGEYKGLKFAKQSEEVSEDDIAKEIAKLLEQNAELVLKEEGNLENGDTAIFDFEGFVDGEAFDGGKAENYELKIGSGQFIPGFENQMVGMAIGEEKDINVTFPENYQAENLKGKDAIFKVKLHEMKVRELPELDDDFVKELDKEGIETVDDLKADTKKTLEEALVTKNKNERVDFAVTEATNNATFELPEEMVEDEKNRLMDNVAQQAKQYNLDLETYLQFSGVSKEDFEKNLRKDAKRSLSYNLVVEAISKEENIQATDEEREAKYQEIADQYNMGIEQVKAALNDSAVDSEVVYRKTIDFLVDSLIIE
ncbi:trigger factor [Candidatus Xianfuyuplasma coldseepsis]|uniref:Trigger factor n=1 Tax=Candidatus Xianfuyuplasma coldseepsis TaxID=2782163 RepID=A0A7L7KSS1_9MOLU|nr:trigger factor [Xianfuyuplasma coldseepsis]QMS85757.1 trigger factor [Xianfuyuplasma coldseepsis]